MKICSHAGPFGERAGRYSTPLITQIYLGHVIKMLNDGTGSEWLMQPTSSRWRRCPTSTPELASASGPNDPDKNPSSFPEFVPGGHATEECGRSPASHVTGD